MNVRQFMLDPITHAVKAMVEKGYPEDAIMSQLKIGEETLRAHLNHLYAAVFDIRSKNWANNKDHNLMYIKIQENYMNDRLRAVGHVFLNEVYDVLGVPRSAQGQLVGWFRAPYSHLIDFEIVDETSDDGFIISFNPDGVIYNKLSTF
jgi:hypothetical protein